MHRYEYAVGIALYYLKPILHIRDLLIAHPFDSVVVYRNIVCARINDIVSRKCQQRTEIFNNVEIYVLLVCAVNSYTAAVETAVAGVCLNNGCFLFPANADHKRVSCFLYYSTFSVTNQDVFEKRRENL